MLNQTTTVVVIGFLTKNANETFWQCIFEINATIERKKKKTTNTTKAE